MIQSTCFLDSHILITTDASRAPRDDREKAKPQNSMAFGSHTEGCRGADQSGQDARLQGSVWGNHDDGSSHLSRIIIKSSSSPSPPARTSRRSCEPCPCTAKLQFLLTLRTTFPSLSKGAQTIDTVSTRTKPPGRPGAVVAATRIRGKRANGSK